MSAGWVAGGVRAHALLSRRLGATGARDLALAAGLDDAVRRLADGPYGRGLRPGMDLPAIEHAVGAGLLWQLRVLAGWQPRAGAQVVRLLAGWFVLANIVDHARELAGADHAPVYRLGALDNGWSHLAGTASAAALRAGLAESPWGDPGGTSASAIALAGQVSWAARVADGVPVAADWAAGALALVAARVWFAGAEHPPDAVAARVADLLGVDPRGQESLAEFAAALRPRARWALSDVVEPERLWLAEAGWWARLERDGGSLTRATTFGAAPLAGCVALLAVDAWRVRAALQMVAAPGADGSVVFDALV
jgi:hypothetical protein